jgi:hypothetical protein
MKYVITVALVGVMAVAARGEETKIKLEEVPQAVMTCAQEAAKKACCDAKLTQASVEVEEGVKTYELQGKLHDGGSLEIDVDADGKLLEVETETTMDKVPKAVKQALKRRMKGFTAKFIEKSKRPASVWYEFEGEDAKGNPTGVEVREDGKAIVIEEDDDIDERAE